MILLILIVGAYFYIAGIIAAHFFNNEKGFWAIILCGLFGILWPCVLISSFFLPINTETDSHDNKHKLQNEGDNL